TRDGASRQLEADPIVMEMPKYDEDGAVVRDSGDEIVTERAGFLGATGTVEKQPQPITAVPGLFGDMVVDTYELLVKLPPELGRLRGREGHGHPPALPPRLAQPRALRLQHRPPPPARRWSRRRGPVGGREEDLGEGPRPARPRAGRRGQGPAPRVRGRARLH